jgi:hypothetical protein
MNIYFSFLSDKQKPCRISMLLRSSELRQVPDADLAWSGHRAGAALHVALGARDEGATVRGERQATAIVKLSVFEGGPLGAS